MAIGRFLPDVYDDGLDESKWAVGGGATLRVSDNVSPAGDVAAEVSMSDRFQVRARGRHHLGGSGGALA